jgi:hypothetical protein
VSCAVVHSEQPEDLGQLVVICHEDHTFAVGSLIG